MSRTALLLIDLQEDYLARPGLQPPRLELIASIGAVLAASRVAGDPVFHVRTGAAMPHRRVPPDATPPPELAERQGEPLFIKRFFSAFDAPGLDDALRGAGITRLRLAGVHAHACIHATALDAYARGFEVEIDEALVGTDDPAFAAQSLRWLDRRAATVITSPAEVHVHRDPCDQGRIIAEIPSMDVREIRELTPATDPAQRLLDWHRQLSDSREKWVEALIDSIAKPRADAEAEVTYGLGLLAHVANTLDEPQADDARSVSARPVGRAGLITPWNNPFAIPLGKLAPAIGFGNSVIWKPALPGTPVALLLRDSLGEIGLGDCVALLTGGASTGRALIEHGSLDMLSITGSVPVGRAIIAAAGHRALPVQAEMGGCNAAIVDSSADLDSAAADLAAAMFSFSGQRCTAIRRVILLADIAAAFTDRLSAAVEALRLGHPCDPATQIGPVIDRAVQRRFLALTGAAAPADQPQAGCWVAPTLLHDLSAGHPLLSEEIFGPLAAIQVARDFDHALALHNATAFGLLGAIYTSEPNSERRFIAEAEAGMLSVGRARPTFAASGPFVGWKWSGLGPPEHGRWNRDTYSKTQVVYR